MTSISDSYILGIKEGRSFLTNNPDLRIEDMKQEVETCKRLALSHSQPMKDIFKGQVDFWNNQIKKGISHD